tara:strand:+ start:122 stop:982 length:861 start_codon:yes stop_codon:yes gene_type:complete
MEDINKNKNNSFFCEKGLDFSDAKISELVQEIDSIGIAEVENVIEPWVLSEANSYLISEGEQMGVQSFSMRWNQMQPSVLTDLQKDSSLKRFFSRILINAGIDAKDDEYIHHVVRCTNGETNHADAYAYHFDQYNLTALMPIQTPIHPSADCGDLVIYPNFRRFSKNVAINLIYKTIFQNSISSILMRSKLAIKLFKAQVIKVKPGSLYLFYGYRTFHGNLPIDKSFRRMTALFHYNDPFCDHEIFKRLEAYRVPPQEKTTKLSRIKNKLGYIGVFIKGAIAEAKK